VHKYILLLVILIAGCQKQTLSLRYDFMPKPLDADSLFYPIPKPNTTGLEDYPFIAIEGGAADVCKDDSCTDFKKILLPAGTLFSDKATKEYAHYKVVVPKTEERLVVDRAMFKEYQKGIYRADSLYNDRIIFLEKQNQRSWLEQNMGYIGFLCGTAFAILIESVTVKAIK
jgi:hypothetical protein